MSAFDRASAAVTSAPRRAARIVRRGVKRVERRLPGPLAVLAYHRIAAPAHDPWELSVTPPHFDEQLAVLRELGRIEPLDDSLAASRLARCRRRQPTFALTFDDGYVDNLDDAVAVLERHEAPATIFIVTEMLDEPAFWWDVLSDLTFGSGITSRRLMQSASRLDLVTDERAHTAADDLVAAHGVLYEALVRQPLADIMRMLDELSARLGVVLPKPSGRPVTTEELRRLASHPLITIGIHTVAHRRLTLLSPDEVRSELTESARRLDELLGRRRRTLAYPYGATSKAVADIARSSGVTHAVTTDARRVGLLEDPMLIPRLHPQDLGGDAFREWITHA